MKDNINFKIEIYAKLASYDKPKKISTTKLKDNLCKIFALFIIIFLIYVYINHNPEIIVKQNVIDDWTSIHLTTSIFFGMFCVFPFNVLLIFLWEGGEYLIDNTYWIICLENNLFDILVGFIGIYGGRVYNRTGKLWIKKIIIIVIAFGFAFTGTALLKEYLGKPLFEYYAWNNEVIISTDTRFYEPTILKNLGSGYFTSVGKISVSISSPYSNFFSKFKIDMSLDNKTWFRVPLYNEKPIMYEDFQSIGLARLTDKQIVLYVKSFIPPQIIQIPYNTTKEDIFTSFQGHVFLKRESSSSDLIIQFFASLTLFGAIMRIHNFLFNTRVDTSAARAHLGLDLDSKSVEDMDIDVPKKELLQALYFFPEHWETYRELIRTLRLSIPKNGEIIWCSDQIKTAISKAEILNLEKINELIPQIRNISNNMALLGENVLKRFPNGLSGKWVDNDPNIVVNILMGGDSLSNELKKIIPLVMQAFAIQTENL